MLYIPAQCEQEIPGRMAWTTHICAHTKHTRARRVPTRRLGRAERGVRAHKLICTVIIMRRPRRVSYEKDCARAKEKEIARARVRESHIFRFALAVCMCVCTTFLCVIVYVCVEWVL